MPSQEADTHGERGHLDDARLIETYLAGRTDAVAQIERWIGAELAARFPALAERPEEREDLCQTLHGRLVANLRQGRFEHRSTLRTYVSRITRYAAIDLLRYRSRRPEEQASEGTPPPIDDDTPERTVEREERKRAILRALRRSPERCRELWRMIFREGLGYREIARRQGIPEGTVKSRAWTCRRRLWELLEGEGPGTASGHGEPSPPSDDRDLRKDKAP